MSTPNFYYVNCLQVFEAEDEFEHENVVENIQEVLSSEIPEGAVVERYEDHLRSYPGKIFFEVVVGDVTVNVVARSGYYAGGNIDYTIEEGEDATKRDVAKAERISQKILRIISQFTTRLMHVGTFSNGEAVYKTI